MEKLESGSYYIGDFRIVVSESEISVYNTGSGSLIVKPCSDNKIILKKEV